MVADFSENYKCIVQDAVQSYHWHSTYATIHPFLCYYQNNGHLRHTCYVIISENTDLILLPFIYFRKSLLNFSLAHFEGQERYITFLMVALPNIKIGRILLIFVIMQKILMFKLTGTFLLHHMEKLQPMVWLVL